MLTTIIGHLICNHLRRRARRPRFAAEVDVDAVPVSQLDVEQRLRRAQRKELVERLLAKLPPDAARLIRWIDLGELVRRSGGIV